MKFSKHHEREEKRLLAKGMKRVWAGLALCWLPVAGLLLSVGGYLRVMVRVTNKYKRRRAACLTGAFIVMAVCTGVLLAEIKLYSQDPEILSRVSRTVWTKIVGEENAERFYPADDALETVAPDDDAGWQFDFGDDESDGTWDEDGWTDEEWDAMFGSDEWLESMDTDGDGFISFEDEWPEGDMNTAADETAAETKADMMNIGQGAQIVLPTE